MNRYLAAALILIFFSSVYAQWEKVSDINVGIAGRMVTHNFTVFCYGDNGPTILLRSTDNGSTWNDIAENAPENFSHIYSFNGRLFTVWIDQIYVSDDFGDSWSPLSTVSIPSGAIIGFTSEGSTLYAYSNRKLIFKSTDSGNTWQDISINDSRNISLTDFAVLGDLYVAVAATIGAFISVDGGQTWNVINPASAISGTYSFNGTIYGLSFGGGIFRFNINSNQWAASNNGIADNGSFQIPKSIYGIGNTVFVLSQGLISNQAVYYSSTDNGETWVPLNMDGITFTNSTGSLDFITANSSYLLTFYYGLFDAQNTGIYRTPVSITTSVNESDLTPANFILHQNFPNPFNPSTTIKYEISNTQFVSIKIYDALGNEVAVLVNEEKPAGSY